LVLWRGFPSSRGISAEREERPSRRRGAARASPVGALGPRPAPHTVVGPISEIRSIMPVRLGRECAISLCAVGDLCASGNQPAPPLERRTDITGRKPSSPTASSGGLLTAGCHRSFAPVMLVAVRLRTPQEALTHVVMRSLSCSHLVLGRISCGYHCYRGGRARDCYSPPASTDHRGQSWLSWGRGVAASPPTLNQSAMTMTP
jgi:hypothetical protein